MSFVMSPKVAYRRLNNLIWWGRLPKCDVFLVDNTTIPCLNGVTINDEIDFKRPVIILNRSSNWCRTLIHEMLHVAEPTLAHGDVFEYLIRKYWRKAKKEIKGLRCRPIKSKSPEEVPNVE